MGGEAHVTKMPAPSLEKRDKKGVQKPRSKGQQPKSDRIRKEPGGEKKTKKGSGSFFRGKKEGRGVEPN